MLMKAHFDGFTIIHTTDFVKNSARKTLRKHVEIEIFACSVKNSCSCHAL